MPSNSKTNTRPPYGHPYPFEDYDDDCIIHSSMMGFLVDVWKGAPANSHLFVATSDPDGGRWREHVIQSGKSTIGLNRFLRAHSRWDFNLYFCPNPFSHHNRRKRFALPSRLGWCDMDDSDPDAYRPQPNHVWETSPNRYQALWLWDKWHDICEAEAFSRELAARHGGDNGWSITKMLRIPGSINHKPDYNEPFVRLVKRNWRKTLVRPDTSPAKHRTLATDFPVLPMHPYAFTRLEVLKKYRPKLDVSARTVLRHDRVIATDRSKWIFVIVAGLYQAGAHIDEIAGAVWSSPYFYEKHGANTEKLEREVSNIIAYLEVDR